MGCFFPCLSSNSLLQLLFPLCVPRNHWLQHYSDRQTPHLCHSLTSSVLMWHKAWHPAWLVDAGQGSSHVLLFHLLLGSVQHFLPVQISIFSTHSIHFVAVGYIDFLMIWREEKWELQCKEGMLSPAFPLITSCLCTPFTEQQNCFFFNHIN